MLQRNEFVVMVKMYELCPPYWLNWLLNNCKHFKSNFYDYDEYLLPQNQTKKSSINLQKFKNLANCRETFSS